MNRYTSNDKILSYKNAVEKNADGKFYNGKLETLTNIVNEIKETKTSLLKSNKKTYIKDHPEAVFIIIVTIFIILVIYEKIIKI